MPGSPLRRLSLALLGALVLAPGGLALGEASHEGWPPIGHLAQHRSNESGVLRGKRGVHNELLGGDGNDTIYAAEMGDVIWGDKNPSGQPTSQRDRLYGGPGSDWIYASHGFNHIWTGAGADHVALVYGHGIVDCNGSGVKTLVMRYLPQNRPWKLVGCVHTIIVRYRA